jgi:hypothetical protein
MFGICIASGSLSDPVDPFRRGMLWVARATLPHGPRSRDRHFAWRSPQRSRPTSAFFPRLPDVDGKNALAHGACADHNAGQQSTDASVPIPKFASICRTFRTNFGIDQDTGKSMIPVPLLNPKFATACAAPYERTSGSRHWT